MEKIVNNKIIHVDRRLYELWMLTFELEEQLDTGLDKNAIKFRGG